MTKLLSANDVWLPIVAETSSCGKNVSSVNRNNKELLPTLELPINNNFKVGID